MPHSIRCVLVAGVTSSWMGENRYSESGGMRGQFVAPILSTNTKYLLGSMNENGAKLGLSIVACLQTRKSSILGGLSQNSNLQVPYYLSAGAACKCLPGAHIHYMGSCTQPRYRSVLSAPAPGELNQKSEKNGPFCINNKLSLEPKHTMA